MSMLFDNRSVDKLKKLYLLKKNEIVSRLREFEQNRSLKGDEDIFTELAFCILTPQSRAKFCWDAITYLKEANLLLKGSADQIKGRLRCVRFHNKKAQYIVDARKVFMKNGRISMKLFLREFNDVQDIRGWLVKNIRGLGYKEASHFLRNMGLGERIAILDRHILRNLNLLGVIGEIPESLIGKKYIEIEKKMAEFARRVAIPLDHLDLLLWYKETGEIFK